MSEIEITTQSLRSIWEGSWGSISPTPRSVEAVQFRKMENGKEIEIVAYPYRLLTRWSLKPGRPERMEIEVASETVTIAGRGLERLMEALNEGQLQCVREQGERDLAGELQVYSIVVKRVR